MLIEIDAPTPTSVIVNASGHGEFLSYHDDHAARSAAAATTG